MRQADLTWLGDGPVATVFSGRQDGVPVALKVFPKRFDKRTMTAFTKEQAVLSGLRRVGSILPVDAVDEVDGELALRMELCPDSLASVVERGGPLPAADVISLGRAVAQALAVAHEAGIVHGGLSPHNVLFRASGEPVVSDFGLTLRQALARDPLHAIEFLPPETLRTGALKRSTDLYGLGALLHYALAGRTPHPGRLGEQSGERVLRILGKPVPAINTAGVPVALTTLVARLLATDPTHRPADATQVVAHLADLLPDAPPQPEADFDDFADAPPTPPTTRRPTFDSPDEIDDFPAEHSSPPPPAPRESPAAAEQQTVRRDQAGPHTVPVADVDDAPPPAAREAPADDRFTPPAAAPKPPRADSRGRLAPASEAPEWDALARAEKARQEQAPHVQAPWEQPAQEAPHPEEPAQARPVRKRPDQVVLVFEEPVRPAPSVDGQARDGMPVREAPPGAAQVAPGQQEAGGGVLGAADTGVPVEDAPTQEAQARELSGWEDPFQRMPDAAQAFAGGPGTPEAWEEPGWEEPADAASEVGDWDAPGPQRFGSEATESSGPAWDGGTSRRGALGHDGDDAAGVGQRDARRWRMWAGVAGGVLVGLLSVVLVLLIGAEPDELASSPREPEDGGVVVGDVRLELSPPVDRNDRVELRWHSTRELDFAVVVAVEGKKANVLLADRRNSMTVDVQPGLKYCFMVQGTDSDRVYESQPVPLRGATCRK